MSLLSKAKPIGQMSKGSLWVIYGKSGTGKTQVLSTFPKPMLYLQFGDDGTGTIGDVEGIDGIPVATLSELNDIIDELMKGDSKYKSVACDTFSLAVQEWIDENSVKKKKRMTQQMWGDIKTDTEELIRSFKRLSVKGFIVALTCHEVADSIDGFEEEITPDVRVSVSKGARTYMESMANVGIHTTIVVREKRVDDEIKEIPVYAAHVGPNPYYWTKTQKPAGIKVPSMVANPTYSKIIKLLKGDKTK